MAEPKSLERHRRENVRKIVSRLDGRQPGLRLKSEALLDDRLRAVRGVPPIDDEALRSTQRPVIGEAITLVLLIHLALRGQEVPEISARPR